MPVGLISDEELEEEMRKSGRSRDKSTRTPPISPSPVVIDIPKRGRSEGDNNVPDSLRQIIAEDALLNGRQSALGIARDFGISASSVSAYTKGATSTTSYDTPSKSIISHINKSRERAIKRAGKTLNSALSSITQEKLDYADAKDLATIAKDMSVVIKNLEPPQVTPVGSPDTVNQQFVIFAPTFRKEESFETIQVNE